MVALQKLMPRCLFFYFLLAQSIEIWVSWFWELLVQDQGVSRVSSFLGLGGRSYSITLPQLLAIFGILCSMTLPELLALFGFLWLVGLCLHVHMVFSLGVCLCPNFLYL